MPTLKINNQIIEISEGTTILKAAQKLGIEIPTMCYLEGLKPSSSCMVCLVEDKKSGKMITACSVKAQEGMEIETENAAILAMRRSALELLLSDHLGDCEAPCQRTCPAGMDIPQMNRLIAKGDFAKAQQIITETIPFPGILGYICPAPCEKTCRRKDVDQAVSICLLKRFVGENDLAQENQYLSAKKTSKNKKLAIVGTGPMGLSAAYYLLIEGYDVDFYDKNEFPGGLMRYEISHELLPIQVLNIEIAQLEKLGAKFYMNRQINDNQLTELSNTYDAIVLANGFTAHFLEFEKTTPQLSSFGRLQIFDLNGKHVFLPKALKAHSKMAIQSIGLGKTIAILVDQYLAGNQDKGIHKRFNSTFGKLVQSEFSEYLKDAQNSEPRTEHKNHLSGFTAEQAIAEAKRCLHCDCRKIDDCILRNLSDKYSANQNNFKLSHRSQVEKLFHPQHVVYEPSKCIKCGICVQITEKAKDSAGFTFIGRGFDVHVGFPLNESIEKALKSAAQECAENCPTGALAEEGYK